MPHFKPDQKPSVAVFTHSNRRTVLTVQDRTRPYKENGQDRQDSQNVLMIPQIYAVSRAFWPTEGGNFPKNLNFDQFSGTEN